MTRLRTDPVDSAHDAGLRYVNGEGAPGISRRKNGRGFAYFNAGGQRVRDKATLSRIRALVIPPAWARVWICSQPNGHLQAVGRDAKGRKQYRYHPLYRRIRDQVKFDRMLFFGSTLPRIRRRINRDLKSAGMPKTKILATVVRLLDETCIRIGNDEYTRANGSYGLTTLHNKHVDVHGAKMRIRFRGKSGQKLDLTLSNDRLARIVKRCQDLPGEELFQYSNGSGELQVITSGDVNAYLREITGEDVTAKDFRTWHGSGEMLVHLRAFGPAGSETEAKKNVLAAIKETAAKLGNRPATCRKYYVHPAVVEGYMNGKLFHLRETRTGARSPLRGHETALLQLLHVFDKRPASRKRELDSKERTLALAS